MEIHITFEWIVHNPAGTSGGGAHPRAVAPLLATPLRRVVNNPRPG
jgi:hypothetical protein